MKTSAKRYLVHGQCYLLAIIFCLTFTAASVAADFYADKVITLIVGVPGGSGGDVAARTMAKEWQKKIPGNPDIIVKNLEGAGGFNALNYLFEKADPDGLSIYYGKWGGIKALEGKKQIRFKPEDFVVIGSGANNRGTICRTDIGGQAITSIQDLNKVDKLLLGGRDARSINDLVGNLALKILGINFTYVPGYRGMAKIAPAIYASEVHCAHTGAGGYSRFFKETSSKGETLLFFYHPFFDENGNQVKVQDDVNFPGNPPSLLDLYKELYGKEPSDKYWETYKWLRSNIHNSSPAVLTPPETPDEIVKILRDSLNGVFADADFRAQWKKQFDAMMFWNPTEVSIAALKNFRNVTPEITEVLDEMGKIGDF